MLPKSSRLTRGGIAELSKGKSASTALISMRFAPAQNIKFSVSVSKKVAPTAVARNTMRRRVYSLLRRFLGEIKAPVHAMIMPKKELVGASPEVIERELRAVLVKAGLI